MNFKSMKPVLSYYGGKQRMASKIIPLIPQHTVYVEPFCGGATLLFKKPWPNVSNKDHYREVINDHDSRLINFYDQLKNNGAEFTRILSLTLHSEAEYRKAKNLDDGTDLERAVKYYINISQSFSNVIGAGWRRGVYSRNESATWLNKVSCLHEYVGRMSSVSIACQDAIKVIRQWDSPQTFFYCDPPYPGTDQGHYKGYEKENFYELVEALDNCQGSFLLSGYDQAGIPENWERFEFSTANSSSGKGKVNIDRSSKATSEELGDRKRTEVVWRRFNRVAPRPEIQKLYDSGKFDCFLKEERFQFMSALK